MLKFLKLTFVILIFCTNSFAGADGELDLSKDMKDYDSLTDNEQYFIKNVLAF